MQATKATKRRADKKSEEFIDLERWGSFAKALRIGVLVTKIALKLLKKNIDYCNQLRKLGVDLFDRDNQEQHFDEELKEIRNRQDFSRKSNLLQVYIFIDDDGLLKVDFLNEKAKFQIILSLNTQFWRTVIRHSLNVQLCCGLKAYVATLGSSSESYESRR